MIKRKLCLVYSLMFVLLLSACSINKTEDKRIITKNSNSTVIDTSVNSSINVSEVTQNTDNNNFDFSKGYFNEKEIAELFSLTKKQIELLIGTEYEVIDIGAEESFTSYKYSKHDISIYYIANDTVEDTSDDNVDFIQCGEKIDFNKVHIGMTYKQIKEIFPTAVIKSWSPEEDSEIVYYHIEFNTNNFNVRLVIKDENSPTTSMTIYRRQDNNIILKGIEYEEFNTFFGIWEATEYLGEGIEYHGAEATTEAEKSENDKIVKEIKEKYLNKELYIDSKSITTFSPPIESGYHVLDWNDLFSIYRQPSDIWDGISPPFLCSSFSLKDFDDSFGLIIDTNGIATLVVKGQFFRLEKKTVTD